MYGKELILDLHNCNTNLFTRQSLEIFLKELCDLINMERCDLHVWEYENQKEREKAEPHLAGVSAVQFIKTSDIVIHTLDKLKKVYLNIFTCKDFDYTVAEKFCEKYFDGNIVSSTLLRRV